MQNRNSASLDAFCARHGIGRTTAYREIRAGRLEARKLGSKTIIKPDAEAAWLETLPMMKIKLDPIG